MPWPGSGEVPITSTGGSRLSDTTVVCAMPTRGTAPRASPERRKVRRQAARRDRCGRFFTRVSSSLFDS
jgi:hypothetical protein